MSINALSVRYDYSNTFNPVLQSKIVFFFSLLIHTRPQIESALEECIATGTYLDASTILPSIMSEEDIADIIAVVLKPNKQKSTQLFGTTSK